MHDWSLASLLVIYTTRASSLTDGRDTQRPSAELVTVTMGNAPGFKQENWQPAKDEVRRILVERAIYRRTIEYTELAGAVHSIKLERQSHELAESLGRNTTDKRER